MSIETHEQLTFTILLKRTISAQLHFIGFMAALVGLGVLMQAISTTQSFGHIAANLIFGITAIILFGASSLYHFLSDGFKLSPKLLRALKNFDHFSIYLFIAGTYTPVLFNSVSPWWRNFLLILVWGIAISGIIYTWKKPKLPKWAQSRYI